MSSNFISTNIYRKRIWEITIDETSVIEQSLDTIVIPLGASTFFLRETVSICFNFFRKSCSTLIETISGINANLSEANVSFTCLITLKSLDGYIIIAIFAHRRWLPGTMSRPHNYIPNHVSQNLRDRIVNSQLVQIPW